MNSIQRARLVSVVVLAVVFASGIVVGFAWDRRLDAAEAAAELERRTERADSARSRAGQGDRADGGEERRRQYMWERVEPTEAQRVELDSIMQVYREASRDFHRESRRAYDEGMRALVLQTREAIKSVLDPAQAARYDSLAAARDDRNRRDDDDDGDGRDGN